MKIVVVEDLPHTVKLYLITLLIILTECVSIPCLLVFLFP